MYRSTSNNQLGFTDFNQPAGYQLDPENEWVKRADLIPWDTLEDRYASLFPSQHGNVAVPFRMALGTLIIQRHYDLTDRAAMSYITANPYPEYFIGLPGYTDAAPFLPSALVKFRKRFSASYLAEVNDAIRARTGRSDALQVKVLVTGMPYAAASFRQALRDFRFSTGAYPKAVLCRRAFALPRNISFCRKHRIGIRSRIVPADIRKTDPAERAAMQVLSILTANLFGTRPDLSACDLICLRPDGYTVYLLL